MNEKKLRELAEEAKPNWHRFCSDRYIAALSPDRVLKLLNELEAARKLRDSLSLTDDHWPLDAYDQARRLNEGDE